MSTVLSAVRLSEVLRLARLRNASDVHLSPGCAPVFRIDGVLHSLNGPPVDAGELRTLLGTMLSDVARRTFEACGDATVTHVDADMGRFRVHAYSAGGDPAVAIRLLAAGIPTLEDLQLPAVIATLADRNSGLVMVTGPTGCGKSTVLAALIDGINRTSARHIITLEDPIEYVHDASRSLVSQREVPGDVPDFSSGVYGALRTDPDVLVIGELRDPATIAAALMAAETGHLVFATLHTADACRTVERMISGFNADAQAQVRVQLAQALAGVVCLRLVPRALGSGRIAAAEILIATEAVRALIRDGKTHQLRNVLITGKQAGMQTLEMHLSSLVSAGEIRQEIAQTFTDRPGDVQQPRFNQ